MAENKCISRICLIGFDENIVKVVKDEEDKKTKGTGENNEIKE